MWGCQSELGLLPARSGPQDELRIQTSALRQQLAETEASRDGAALRVRQLEKAVVESEEGGSTPVSSPRSHTLHMEAGDSLLPGTLLVGGASCPDTHPPRARMAQVSAEPDGPGGSTARRSVDGRLSGAQAELVQQEENSRRAERERRAVLDRVAALERSLQAMESELQASQVGGGGMGGLGVPASAPVRGCECLCGYL